MSKKDMSGDSGFSVQNRIIFFSSVDVNKNMAAIASAHLVLDPFPSSGFLTILQSLALGVPVVSLSNPSSRMSGRFAEAVYSMMNYTSLLAPTISEYIQLALTLTHNPKIRASHTEAIMERRHFLFETLPRAKQDWKRFLELVHAV
jgi:predicted O-linked N-acetylglucosamine transferase (SPINDLY family)